MPISLGTTGNESQRFLTDFSRKGERTGEAARDFDVAVLQEEFVVLILTDPML